MCMSAVYQSTRLSFLVCLIGPAVECQQKADVLWLAIERQLFHLKDELDGNDDDDVD